MYGNQGTKEFNKIKDKVDRKDIEREIDLLTARARLSNLKAKELKKRLKEII